MTTDTARLCQPSGFLPGGNGKARAACRCGYVTTPRATETRALNALLSEHGYTEGDACSICGTGVGHGSPWETFKPLEDGAREVYVCKDRRGCSERYDEARDLDRLICGCSHVTVALIGHYHPWSGR